ncbi:MAG: hypothetical protein A4E73_03381 [Syntrophaceae bacterium PtaU1.Bin231]|nr:MAG: hypothetical protein A4E73_03381 [Syntrophaceae bacterium PtaU1.Bin231]
MRRKILAAVAVLACIALLALSGDPGFGSDGFSEIEKHWGKPVRIVKLPDGSEKRYYPLRGLDTGSMYAYFVVKNGVVVDQGATSAGF